MKNLSSSSPLKGGFEIFWFDIKAKGKAGKEERTREIKRGGGESRGGEKERKSRGKRRESKKKKRKKTAKFFRKTGTRLIDQPISSPNPDLISFF